MTILCILRNAITSSKALVRHARKFGDKKLERLARGNVIILRYYYGNRFIAQSHPGKRASTVPKRKRVAVMRNWHTEWNEKEV